METQTQIKMQALISQRSSTYKRQQMIKYLDTKAAQRSGSFLPSKESSSAATRFRLSSAYLRRDIFKILMRIEDGHDGDDDAPICIWWIVKYEYGTENDINVLGYLSEKSSNDD